MSANTAPDRTVLRQTAVAALVLSLAATIFFGGLLKVYDRFGTRLLSQLEVSVGEIVMREGMREQQAGAIENAKERYTTALSARFAGEQNRIYTLKLLGAIYAKEGNYEKALPLLEAAVRSTRVEPTFYEPYCDALIQLKRYDDAAHALAKWDALATQKKKQEWIADQRFYAGTLAVLQGRHADARKAFEDGALLFPGERNAEAAAKLAFEDKDFDAALKFVDECLAAGGGESMRALRGEILKALGNRGGFDAS